MNDIYKTSLDVRKQSVSEFDPVEFLIKRKKESEEIPSKIEFENEDVKELEKFCKNHGIIGLNFKNMNPRVILSMLKKNMGIREDLVENKRELLKG